MGFMSILNLYKDRTIMMFKECYALEKIHGSSSHVNFKDNQLTFFSGGESHDNFVKLFNQEELLEGLKKLGVPEITLYGEVYGGKCQGMSHMYGKDLKFVGFDVCFYEDVWQTVPEMTEIFKSLNLDIVPWRQTSTDLEALDKQRDMMSEQAIKLGMGSNHIREGVVLRPLIELKSTTGERIICKHKGEKFNERATPQKNLNSESLKVLEDAQAIANEWVILNRLTNVLSHVPNEDVKIENTGKLVQLMLADVLKESKGEIIESPEVHKAIKKKAAELIKHHFTRIV